MKWSEYAHTWWRSHWTARPHPAVGDTALQTLHCTSGSHICGVCVCVCVCACVCACACACACACVCVCVCVCVWQLLIWLITCLGSFSSIHEFPNFSSRANKQFNEAMLLNSLSLWHFLPQGGKQTLPSHSAKTDTLYWWFQLSLNIEEVQSKHISLTSTSGWDKFVGLVSCWFNYYHLGGVELWTTN